MVVNLNVLNVSVSTENMTSLWSACAYNARLEWAMLFMGIGFFLDAVPWALHRFGDGEGGLVFLGRFVSLDDRVGFLSALSWFLGGSLLVSDRVFEVLGWRAWLLFSLCLCLSGYIGLRSYVRWRDK